MGCPSGTWVVGMNADRRVERRELGAFDLARSVGLGRVPEILASEMVGYGRSETCPTPEGRGVLGCR